MVRLAIPEWRGEERGGCKEIEGGREGAEKEREREGRRDEKIDTKVIT